MSEVDVNLCNALSLSNIIDAHFKLRNLVLHFDCTFYESRNGWLLFLKFVFLCMYLCFFNNIPIMHLTSMYPTN